MNITQTRVRHAERTNPLRPTLQFASALLSANLRNLKGLALTLGLPFFMLFTIWVPSLAGDEESQELMQLLFPAIILLSVLMPGLTQATRLARWREQHIFQRLALAPVPMANLMVGTGLTQVVIGIGQGILMLLFGVFLVGLQMSWQSILFVLAAMVLASMAFIAYGSMIAAFSSKADIAGYLFFFTIMPLTFLASFPPQMMPDALNRVTPWLPTSMAIELIGSLFLDNQLPDSALWPALGLLLYTAGFTAVAVRKFRWKA